MQEVLIVFSFGLLTMLLALFVGAPLLYVFDTLLWPRLERECNRLVVRWSLSRPRGTPGKPRE